MNAKMRLRPFLAGLARHGTAAPLALALGACTGTTSPSVPLFGAYFPSWLICTAAGVLGAIVTRVLFVKLGIDETLPWRLLVYACLAATIGFVVALTIYGR